MADTGTGIIEEIPIGTVFFNYTKCMGFSEMCVDSFNDVTSLYVVVSGGVECCMTPGQVNKLIEGEILDFESLRNRLVMTRISDGEYTVSKLLKNLSLIFLGFRLRCIMVKSLPVCTKASKFYRK